MHAWSLATSFASAVTFTPKPMKYNLGITVVSLIAIFVPTFIGLLVLTFHRNSVVYAKRLKMAAAVAAAGGTSGAATASAPGTAVLVPQGSKAQLRAAVQASDLHGSLEALLAEIVQLLMDLWAFLSLRLLAAAVLMGSGVVFMHFTGMAAIRASGLTMTMNRLMMWLCFPIAWIGAAAALFLMFHMHGLRRRLLASVVIGIAVNLIHYFGFFSMSFVAVDDLEPPPSTETLVYSENACVFVSLLSSLARFFFMGVIAATSA
jgi:NO-binding membrane sensor protein with MHYT domain